MRHSPISLARTAGGLFLGCCIIGIACVAALLVGTGRVCRRRRAIPIQEIPAPAER